MIFVFFLTRFLIYFYYKKLRLLNNKFIKQKNIRKDKKQKKVIILKLKLNIHKYRHKLYCYFPVNFNKYLK